MTGTQNTNTSVTTVNTSTTTQHTNATTSQNTTTTHVATTNSNGNGSSNTSTAQTSKNAKKRTKKEQELNSPYNKFIDLLVKYKVIHETDKSIFQTPKVKNNILKLTRYSVMPTSANFINTEINQHYKNTFISSILCIKQLENPTTRIDYSLDTATNNLFFEELVKIYPSLTRKNFTSPTNTNAPHIPEHTNIRFLWYLSPLSAIPILSPDSLKQYLSFIDKQYTILTLSNSNSQNTVEDIDKYITKLEHKLQESYQKLRTTPEYQEIIKKFANNHNLANTKPSRYQGAYNYLAPCIDTFLKYNDLIPTFKTENENSIPKPETLQFSKIIHGKTTIAKPSKTRNKSKILYITSDNFSEQEKKIFMPIVKNILEHEIKEMEFLHDNLCQIYQALSYFEQHIILLQNKLYQHQPVTPILPPTNTLYPEITQIAAISTSTSTSTSASTSTSTSTAITITPITETTEDQLSLQLENLHFSEEKESEEEKGEGEEKESEEDENKGEKEEEKEEKGEEEKGEEGEEEEKEEVQITEWSKGNITEVAETSMPIPTTTQDKIEIETEKDKEIEKLKQELQLAKQIIEQHKKNQTNTDQQLKQSQEQEEKTLSQLEKLRTKLSKSELAKNKTQQELSKTQQELSETQQELQQKNRKLEKQKTQSTAIQNKLNNTQQQLETAKLTLKQKNVELNNVQQEKKRKNVELKQKETELTEIKQTLKQTKKQKTQNFNDADSPPKSILEEIQSLINRNQTLENSNQTLKNNISQLEKLLTESLLCTPKIEYDDSQGTLSKLRDREAILSIIKIINQTQQNINTGTDNSNTTSQKNTETLNNSSTQLKLSQWQYQEPENNKQNQQSISNESIHLRQLTTTLYKLLATIDDSLNINNSLTKDSPLLCSDTDLGIETSSDADSDNDDIEVILDDNTTQITTEKHQPPPRQPLPTHLQHTPYQQPYHQYHHRSPLFIPPDSYYHHTQLSNKTPTPYNNISTTPTTSTHNRLPSKHSHTTHDHLTRTQPLSHTTNNHWQHKTQNNNDKSQQQSLSI